MKVKTIVGKDFDDLCFDLACKIIEDDYKPDVVIGIKNGGSIIAKKVLNYLDITCKPKYYELTIQHNCTKTFEKIHIGNILRYLPIFSLDAIRIMQMNFYEFLYDHFNYNRKYYVEKNLDKDLKSYLMHGNKKILIIDDTIDSGNTMDEAKVYVDWFGLPMPGYIRNEIRICTATTTYKHPKVKPDYSLYNRTIIRWPWAFDNKNNKIE